MYNNPENTLNHKDNDISATSISEITNIPRATVIRKLNHLVKLKLFKQNKITKKVIELAFRCLIYCNSLSLFSPV